jgi:hypothetical protein
LAVRDSACPRLCVVLTPSPCRRTENLGYAVDVAVGGTRSPNMTLLADGSLLAFAMPVATLGYATVSVEQSDHTVVSAANILFYAEDCIRAGLFWTGTGCAECPAGAECPGGGRIWPLAGWWNAGEMTGGVTRCQDPAAERCLGGQTSPCGTGYGSAYCGRCATGYYDLQGSCQVCASDGIIALLYIIQVTSGSGCLFRAVCSPTEQSDSFRCLWRLLLRHWCCRTTRSETWPSRCTPSGALCCIPRGGWGLLVCVPLTAVVVLAFCGSSARVRRTSCRSRCSSL